MRCSTRPYDRDRRGTRPAPPCNQCREHPASRRVSTPFAPEPTVAHQFRRTDERRGGHWERYRRWGGAPTPRTGPLRPTVGAPLMRRPPGEHDAHPNVLRSFQIAPNLRHDRHRPLLPMLPPPGTAGHIEGRLSIQILVGLIGLPPDPWCSASVVAESLRLPALIARPVRPCCSPPSTNPDDHPAPCLASPSNPASWEITIERRANRTAKDPTWTRARQFGGWTDPASSSAWFLARS